MPHSGGKSEALREGRRAAELLPVRKDSINGALVAEYLAVTYAWTGEKDAAIEQLSTVVNSARRRQLRTASPASVLGLAA